MGELIVYPFLRRNHWANLTQISCGDSLGRGNKSLSIYGKTPLKSTSPEPEGR